MTPIIFVIVRDKPTAAERLIRYVERLGKAFMKAERKPFKASKVRDAYAQIGLEALDEDDWTTANLALKLAERWDRAAQEKEDW